MFIHLKRGGKETKPLFICNNELTSDCSKEVRNISSPLIGWTAIPAKMICVWKGKTCPKFDYDLTPKKHFCTAWSQRCDQISYRRGEVVDLPGSSRYYHVISKMSIYMFKNLMQFCLCNPTSYLPICYISVASYPKWQFLNTVLTIIFGTILIGSENGMVDMTCMKRSANVQL